VRVKKNSTFAPALRHTFITNSAYNTKKAKKDLQGINKGFTFALRKTKKFFEEFEDKKEKEFFFRFTCELIKKMYFCTR
jgi:hypothetical protein